MKILIHGINYSPELTGIGKYSGEMAEWLAARGHEVRVVTAPPYYPEWRVGAGYSGWKYQQEGRRSTQGGLSVWRCPLWVPARPSGVKRLLHLASFALSSLPVMLRQVFWKPDVVFVIEPPLMCSPAALLVARMSGARAWLHVQDFEVDAAFDLGILPPGVLRSWVLRIESALMRKFDRVSTISRNMLARLADKGVERERCVLFPNWVATEAIYPLPVPGVMRGELGIEADKIVALYSGNMGEKQGLEVVLDAARLLTSSHIQFVLCGDGAARQRLMHAHQDLGNVIWIPLQPLERLNDLLGMADIHLLPQRADAADLVMPSKLTGMLASGRPVVTTAHPDTQVAEVVRECGVVTKPGDADALAQAVLLLAHDELMRAKLGERARAYALAHLERDVVLTGFEQTLPEIC